MSGHVHDFGCSVCHGRCKHCGKRRDDLEYRIKRILKRIGRRLSTHSDFAVAYSELRDAITKELLR